MHSQRLMWTETCARRLRITCPGLVHGRDVWESQAGPECGKGGSNLHRLCPDTELRGHIHPAGAGLPYNLCKDRQRLHFNSTHCLWADCTSSEEAQALVIGFPFPDPLGTWNYSLQLIFLSFPEHFLICKSRDLLKYTCEVYLLACYKIFEYPNNCHFS